MTFLSAYIIVLSGALMLSGIFMVPIAMIYTLRAGFPGWNVLARGTCWGACGLVVAAFLIGLVS